MYKHIYLNLFRASYHYLTLETEWKTVPYYQFFQECHKTPSSSVTKAHDNVSDHSVRHVLSFGRRRTRLSGQLTSCLKVSIILVSSVPQKKSFTFRFANTVKWFTWTTNIEGCVIVLKNRNKPSPIGRIVKSVIIFESQTSVENFWKHIQAKSNKRF